MSDAALLDKLEELNNKVMSFQRAQDTLSDAILAMMRQDGKRLSRADVCERLGVCRQTLAKRVIAKEFPAPLKGEGKWLLADVVEYQLNQIKG
jgi:hypothetical protein